MFPIYEVSAAPHFPQPLKPFAIASESETLVSQNVQRHRSRGLRRRDLRRAHRQLIEHTALGQYLLLRSDR